jgi:hypothetical protein
LPWPFRITELAETFRLCRIRPRCPDLALREAGRIFDRGIEEVHLLPRKNGARALFLPKTREQIVQRLRRLEERWATVEGRLLMADVKEDALRCRLHPSLGEPIICSFSEDAVVTVLRYMRRFVRVKGDATVERSTGRIRRLVIHDIEPIEQPDQPSRPEVPSAFWESTSFQELAMQQEVYPVDDLGKVVGGWPEGADFDSFLRSVLSARSDDKSNQISKSCIISIPMCSYLLKEDTRGIFPALPAEQDVGASS